MAKGTFINHLKKGVRKVFKDCLFRDEKHFVECYKEHYPLGFDNITIEKATETIFILHIDFGDLQVDMRIKTHKSYTGSNYVLDEVE